jgi:thiamine biosynthesis protein ThiS
MLISVNGKLKEINRDISIAWLIEAMQINPKQVAIERNLEIVPRSRYGEVILNEGDEIEIVQFIGGG